MPSSIIEPIWDQFSALLQAHAEPHPLGCYRWRITDRVVFDKLVQVLVFRCAYARIHRCLLLGNHPAPTPG